MRSLLSRRGLGVIAALLVAVAGSAMVLAPMLTTRPASADDFRAAAQKANLFIELIRNTERAVESWERYASWVNLRTGPTGKERYISYGMYDVHDVSGMLKEIRKTAGSKPKTPKIDAAAKRYMAAFEALAPVMNQATAYYDRKGYQSDGIAEGQALHKRMVPLATAFLAEREALMREVRPFVRQVEQQEVDVIEVREGRTRAWHVARVMNAANRAVDLFPRVRPTPISQDDIEERIKALGPNTPGEKFDEIISGVTRPTGILIDVKAFDAGIKRYAEAVEVYDRFAAEKPDGLKDFKDLPRQLLSSLQALQEPLNRSGGRDFDGADPLVGRVAQIYFAMISASGSLSGSQIRFMP